MKKLMLLLSIMSVFNINADMRIDVKTEKYYTVPSAPDIDQEEYHILWVEIEKIVEKCKLEKNPPLEMLGAIYGYLILVGTPTAKRVMSDLKKALKQTIDAMIPGM